MIKNRKWTREERRIFNLVDRYGSCDGEHHKQWILSQIMLIFLGSKDFKKWAGEYWDKGIAP